MAAAIASAFAEMTALEQEFADLIRLGSEVCGSRNGSSGSGGSDDGGSDGGSTSPPRTTTHGSGGRVRDFTERRRDEIARAGRRVSPAGLQDVTAWSVWQRLGRFASEINPSAYSGRVTSYFNKTAASNEQALKEMEEAFDEVRRLDAIHAQRVEEAIALLRTIRQSIEIASTTR
jgi:hypothetical protein